MQQKRTFFHRRKKVLFSLVLDKGRWHRGKRPNIGSVIFLFAGKEVFLFPRTPNSFQEKRSVFFISLYLPISGIQSFFYHEGKTYGFQNWTGV